jgi:multidrug efflux pump subunit AcrB
MSVLMGQLGLPLIIALAGSLVIALTLVPLAMSRMKDRKNLPTKNQDAQAAPPKRKFQHIMHLLEFIIHQYGRCLTLSLKWRLASVLLLAALVYLTVKVPMKEVGMADLGKLDNREVTLSVEPDQNFDYDRMATLFEQLEEKIDEQRDELGIKSMMQMYSPGQGNIRVYLYTEDDGPLGENPPFTTEEVERILS